MPLQGWKEEDGDGGDDDDGDEYNDDGRTQHSCGCTWQTCGSCRTSPVHIRLTSNIQIYYIQNDEGIVSEPVCLIVWLVVPSQLLIVDFPILLWMMMPIHQSEPAPTDA